jgi:hypothetical protein
MYKYFFIVIILIVVACRPVHAQPPGVTDGALQYEQAAWKRMISAISSKDLLNSKNRFFNEMLGYQPDERALGFDCYWYKFSRGNDSWVTVVAFQGEIMQYIIDYSRDHDKLYEYIVEHDAALRQKVAGLGNLKKGRAYFYLNDSLYVKYKKKVAATLGEIAFSDTNRFVRKCFQTLTSPMSELQFGMICGNGGYETEGYLAINYLERKVAIAAIRAIARGYNPEGRMFAVESLLRAAERGDLSLTTDDIATINKVLSLTTEVKTCNGCMGRSVKPRDALPAHLLTLVGQ